MKLNLLPTYVSKEGRAKTAIFFAAALAIVGALAAFFMITKSGAELKEVKDQIPAAQIEADNALRTSQEADTVIAQARDVLINRNLAATMWKHNSDYTDLYEEVMRYIPAYLRVTNMTATGGATGTSVAIDGVIHTHQQYADLMPAMLRIPGATGVSRTGFTITENMIPALIESDQTGRPVVSGDPNVPDDPLARLEYYKARGTVKGFDNVGGFGSDAAEKGAMPEWSAVRVTVNLTRVIVGPDVKGTLTAQAANSAAPQAPTAPSPSAPGVTTRPGGGVPPPSTPGKGGSQDDR